MASSFTLKQVQNVATVLSHIPFLKTTMILQAIANKIRRCKTDAFPGLDSIANNLNTSALKPNYIRFAFVLCFCVFNTLVISFFFRFVGNIFRLEFDNPERPECTNLLSVYQLITGKSKQVPDVKYA